MKLLALVVALSGPLALCGGDPSRPPAAQPAAQQTPSRPPAEPEDGIDVRGRVADVSKREGSDGEILATVRVEGRRDADTRVDAATVRITGDTQIAFKSTGRAATVDDVRMGALVEVRFAGPVAESYPVQATAGEIAILDAPPGKSLETDPGPFEGTSGVVDVPGRAAGTAVLRAVRTARQEGFDRTVFEFEGGALPAYHIEYVDKPVRGCGSGEAVPVRGDGWLHVRFSGAQAHTEAGEATVGFRENHVNLPNLLEIESICDFEGEVGWVLGVQSPNHFRALELSGPTRLVVDVKHK